MWDKGVPIANALIVSIILCRGRHAARRGGKSRESADWIDFSLELTLNLLYIKTFVIIERETGE